MWNAELMASLPTSSERKCYLGKAKTTIYQAHSLTENPTATVFSAPFNERLVFLVLGERVNGITVLRDTSACHIAHLI